MTKGTPHQLFLSEATRQALREPSQDLVFVAEMEVRGRRERLRVWTVVDESSPTGPQPRQVGSA
jgi:class 3 adenylate cyclase